MSAAATSTHHRRHPTVADYWKIAAILGVITAVEVALSYMDALDRTVIVVSLIVLSLAKFAMVVAYFMHLRFDKPLYTRFLLMGMIGALGLFTVMLFTFGLLIGN
jgi:cytochrome c oxidase subunit 4